jgi:uncharacterized membrane protein YcjF (UPF0283 family)
MGEFVFVSSMALVGALLCLLTLIIVLFGVHLVVTEYRRWHRYFRQQRARREIEQREAKAKLALLRQAKNEKFFEDIRKAFNDI